MNHKGSIFFTLHGINKYRPKEKFVIVDMGAVKFVANGADVMAPGIVDADININENDQVWICDEKNQKPLAIGIALINGEKMIAEKQGKAITIVHYVGDLLWNLTAKSL
jgi:PUA domain protein